MGAEEDRGGHEEDRGGHEEDRGGMFLMLAHAPHCC